MLSLSYEEAVQFVHNKLGITEVEKRLENDKFSLLNEMVVAFVQNIPFQNLTHMANRPEDRCIPNPDEIKEDLMTGRGGMCVALNGFFNTVLQVLGYNTYLTGGRMWGQDVTTHALIIVHSLQQSDDNFLVDVGIGYPMIEIVNLDFEKESTTVTELMWWRKIVRLSSETEGSKCFPMFARVRKPINPSDILKFGIFGKDKPDEWNTVCTFSLKPQSFEELCDIVNSTLYSVIEQPLSHCLVLAQWRKEKAIALIDKCLLLADEEGQLHQTILETDDDIVKSIIQEISVLDEDVIVRATQHWRASRAAHKRK